MGNEKLKFNVHLLTGCHRRRKPCAVGATGNHLSAGADAMYYGAVC